MTTAVSQHNPATRRSPSLSSAAGVGVFAIVVVAGLALQHHTPGQAGSVGSARCLLPRLCRIRQPASHAGSARCLIPRLCGIRQPAGRSVVEASQRPEGPGR